MTNDPQTREIEAPAAFLFGKGVVLLTNAVEADNLKRSMLILRESWEDPCGPVGHTVPDGHPRTFGDDDGTPQFPPNDTTSLIFENETGLQNLIYQLIALHDLRYPGGHIPMIPEEVVRDIAAHKHQPVTAARFAQVLGED